MVVQWRDLAPQLVEHGRVAGEEVEDQTEERGGVASAGGHHAYELVAEHASIAGVPCESLEEDISPSPALVVFLAPSVEFVSKLEGLFHELLDVVLHGADGARELGVPVQPDQIAHVEAGDDSLGGVVESCLELLGLPGHDRLQAPNGFAEQYLGGYIHCQSMECLLDINS